MTLKGNIQTYFERYKTELIQSVSHFWCKINNTPKQFRVKIDTKCLVFSHYIGAETKALGGLIAQYPKNFEVLALTNGSSMIKNLKPVESANVKKEQFTTVMKNARVKGFKVFDIDCGTLENEYNKFRKIDISEADYIFVPNIFDPSPDARALIEHFRKILKEKEHKKTLQILMYESDYPLTFADCYADISNICETKRKMLEIYYPDAKNIIEGVIGLNKFRSLVLNIDLCESFTSFWTDDFLDIPLE